MSCYKRFEDLPVWQSAAELYDRTDDFLDRAPPRMRPSFRDQLERAALSVSNNIAEGFERGTTNELLMFLYIARGSAGEVRSMLVLALRRPYLSDFRSEI
jgi:four helix bundle protein